MKTLLHVLTRPADALAAELVEATRRDPTVRVEVVDLNGDAPDYGRLLDALFEADAVATW